MIKFFHTADLHLGVENYGRVDSEIGIHTRLLDFKKSFEECVNRAIAEDIDFFLFCGDAYKTAYPTPTQQKILMEVFFKLQKVKIPIVIIVGNHDHPLSYGKANALDVFADLPLDGFHVFSKPELLILETKNGPIQIVGIPWPTRNNVISKEEHKNKNFSDITSYLSCKVGEIIQRLALKVDKNIPAILASHLTVSNGVFSGSEKIAVFGSDPVFLPSQLALPEFRYVALGHLHRFQDLNKSGHCPIVYSGSVERVDFGERKDIKGYCRVAVDLKNTKYDFVELQTRPFIQIELVLNDEEDNTQQIINEIKKYEIKDAILKIIYHLGKKDEVDINVIFKACSEAMYVVGIIPIKSCSAREVRGNLKVDMDIFSLVGNYLDGKESLKQDKERLLEKTKMLCCEIEFEKVVENGYEN